MALLTIRSSDPNKLQSIADELIHACLKRGASSVDVAASRTRGFSVNVRKEAVDTLEYQNDANITLTVYVGQQSGSVSTSDLSSASIDQCVDKAITIAKQTQADPFSGLPEKNCLAFDYHDLDLYHPWQLTPEQAIEMGCQLEIQAKSLDARIINSEGTAIHTHNTVGVTANSLGFSGCVQRSYHSISCCLIAGQNAGMQRDYDYTCGRSADDLASLKTVAQGAVNRTVRRLDARCLPTQTCPVIFENTVAKSILGAFTAAITGSNIYRRSSFLCDAMDKPVFAAKTVIKENPFLPGALGSAPFDAEGVKCQAREIVADGILQGLVLNSYSARKLGLKTTGNAGGVRNLTISKGEPVAFADLLKKMDSGLLVTELIGQDINLVTGDYSRGAFGFWVENGEIQYPVEEITIAGNLKDVFRQLIAVGDDVDYRGNIRTGSLLFEHMTVAGR